MLSGINLARHGGFRRCKTAVKLMLLNCNKYSAAQTSEMRHLPQCARILPLTAVITGAAWTWMSSSASAQVAIGLDFVGGSPSTSTTAMAATESAGVVAKTQWNDLSGASGTSSSLVNSSGAASGLTVNYSSLNTWADGAIADTAGNQRMMRGYLDFNVNNGTTSVAVSGISSVMYDVYVYTNGDENTRTGQFSLGGQNYWVKDNATFSGTFVQGTGNVDPGSSAAAVAGNYMVFSGLREQLVYAQRDRRLRDGRCAARTGQRGADRLRAEYSLLGPQRFNGRCRNFARRHGARTETGRPVQPDRQPRRIGVMAPLRFSAREQMQQALTPPTSPAPPLA